MNKTILTFLFALLCAACAEGSDHRAQARGPQIAMAPLHDRDGSLYIRALVEAVQDSQRIVISEHSHVDDVLDQLTQPQRPAGYIPIIYSTHELSASERVGLLMSLLNMSGKTQDAESACMFEPHHTITFFYGQSRSSAMRICFQCGQVEWDGTSSMRPWALVPALNTLVIGVGMRPQRDWRALARRS